MGTHFQLPLSPITYQSIPLIILDGFIGNNVVLLFMKIRYIALVLSVFFKMSEVAVLADTAVFAGSGTTADGSVIMARSVDPDGPVGMRRVAIEKHQDNRPGKNTYWSRKYFVAQFPSSTFKTVESRRMKYDNCGEYPGATINEKGFVCLGGVRARVRPEVLAAMPYVVAGVPVDGMPHYLGMSCANCADALRRFAHAMGERGTAESAAYFIADTNEAWIVELYAGREWAARRLKDDETAVFNGTFMLDGLDRKSVDWRTSPGIESVAKAKGLAKYDANGMFDLRATYYGNEPVKSSIVAAAGSGITVRSLIDRLRSGNGGFGDVVTLDRKAKPDRASVLWSTLSDLRYSPFLPFPVSSTQFEEAYEKDYLPAGNVARTKFDDTLACDVFRRLEGIAVQDAALYGRGVTDYWDAREDMILINFEKLFKGPVAALENRVRDEQRKALNDALRLREELEFCIPGKDRFNPSDFDRIAITQMQRDSTVRYPVILRKGEFDFSGTLKYAPEMSEWKDPTLIQWGIPAAAGRKKVLVTVCHSDVFAVQHLMNRLDVDCDIIVTPYNNNWKHKNWLAQLDRLEFALASDRYDGYVFIGASPSAWPLRCQRKLAEDQLSGKGVAIVNGGGWGVKLEDNVEFALGAPRSFRHLAADTSPEADRYDLVYTNDTLNAIKTGWFGKGRISQYSFPPSATRTYMVSPYFSPSWIFTPDRVFRDEYCYAYSVRSVMEGLGMRGPATVKSVRAGELTLVSSNAFNGVASLAVRDTWGRAVWTKDIAVMLEPGETKLSFEMPLLPVGDYSVDAILKNNGKNCDFAADIFEVEPGATRFAVAKMEKILYLPEEKLVGIFGVTNAVSGIKVLAEIRDSHQRAVLRGECTVGRDGSARLELGQERLRGNCHCAYFTLVGKDGKKLDESMTWFFRKVGDDGLDFRVFDGASSHGGKDCEPRLAALAYNGMNLFQEGSVERLFYGNDPCIRDRIPGNKSNYGGSICSPKWHRYLERTFTKHAKALAKRNGRVISLGDDSAAIWDFSPLEPDWAASFFDGLEKVIRERAESDRKAGVPRAGLETAARAWMEERGFDPKIVGGGSFYWGYRQPIQNKIGLKNLCKALKEEDVAIVRTAIADSYDDIRVFNAANRVNAKDFDSIDLAVVQAIDPVKECDVAYFVQWLAAKYGTVAKLNEAWCTSFTDPWKEITAAKMAELDKAKNVVAQNDRNKFFNWEFDENCRIIGKAVKTVDPDIVPGFGASWVGVDLQDQLEWLGMSAAYNGYPLSVNRSKLRKNVYLGECIGWYGWPVSYQDEENVSKERRERQGWEVVLGGGNFVWMWTAAYGLDGARQTPPGGYGYLFDTLGEIARGPAALIRRSRADDTDIAVMVDCTLVGDGLDNQAGRFHWSGVIEKRGLQWDLVTRRDLREGELAKRGVKVLVIPTVGYFQDDEAKIIREFAAKGGYVLASGCTPGSFDIDGRPLKKSVFGDDFFTTNFTGRAIFTGTDTQKGFDLVIDELCIKPKVKVLDAKGERYSRAGVRCWRRQGGEFLFSVTHPHDDKDVYPIHGTVVLPSKGYIYDVRAGKAVNEEAVNRFDIDFLGLDTRFFSFQPEKVGGLSVDFADKPVRGGMLKLRAKLACASGTTRVFRVEFVPPEGFSQFVFAPIERYLADAPSGELKLDVPLAFDERGDLTVRVTDVATGITAEKALLFR